MGMRQDGVEIELPRVVLDLMLYLLEVRYCIYVARYYDNRVTLGGSRPHVIFARS